MSIIKRLSATLHARLDRVVNQIENHDAVVEAALAESREALARAKVQLARVRQDGERLHKELAEMRGAETAWTERARAAADDEATALECLRRRNAARTRQSELAAAISRHQESEERLGGDVKRAEEQLMRLSEQRNLMRTRESAAEALSLLSGFERTLPAELDRAFERWSVRVTETELAAGGADAADPLARGFEAEEERAALRAELAELLNDREVRDEQ